MPIPTSISEMSVTPSLNSPQGTESAKGTIDDYLRAHAAFIRQTSDLVLGATVTLPSASTVAIGFAASSNIAITGTTTINAFDTYAEGALRYVTFSGAMTLVHSAALALPTAANITTISGDSGLFKSLGSGNWKCLMYQRLSGLTLTQASASANGYLTAADWGTFNGKQAALGFTPYNSTNPSGYISSINSGNVTAALGYTPYNSTNPSGYISGINSAQVVSALGFTPQAALGFTPYNSTNPAGYIAGINSGNVTAALGFTPANAAGQAFSGNISAPVVTQTSDERKKKNWQRLPVDFIEKFAAIKKAGLFQWKKGGAHCVSVGAQSLEGILPAAVHTDEKGNKSVNTGGAALAITHELSREVVKLRARLVKLESAK